MYTLLNLLEKGLDLMGTEAQALWIAFGILAAAAGGGFILLLIRFIAVSAKIEGCASYKWVGETFYERTIIDLHMKTVEKQLNVISAKLDHLTDRGKGG